MFGYLISHLPFPERGGSVGGGGGAHCTRALPCLCAVSDCAQTYDNFPDLGCNEGHELFRYTQLNMEFTALSSW